MRPPGQSPFSEEDKRLFDRLMPHLVRASRVDRRLRTQRQDVSLSKTLLDQLADAIFVLDGEARVVRANAAAEALLTASRDLTARAGRLRAVDQREAERLHRLVISAAGRDNCSGARGGAMVLDNPDGKRLILVVAPLMPSVGLFDLGGKPLVLVIVSLPRSAPTIELRLIQAFGLTPAEARLAAALIGGDNLRSIADQFKVGLPTLRTQLKSVLAKTSTRRQGELMQLGLRLGPLAGFKSRDC